MQWKLSEEQVAYQEALRGWLAQVAPPATLRTWLDAGDHSAFEGRLAADGWLGVGVPESMGGQGGDMVELALTAEELARAGVPSSGWLASMLAIAALSGGGGPAPSSAARDIDSDLIDVFAGALAGEVLALLVPAESVPADAAAQATLTMTAEGAVSGTVRRVLGADLAVRFVAPVATPGGPELRLIDAADAVVTRRSLLDRTRSVADVTLDAAQSVAVPAGVDTGRALEAVSLTAAVLVAADSLGTAVKMLDLAVEYSKQRQQFGVAIASFQAVKHAAASMLVTTEASRSVVYLAAATLAAGAPDAAMVAAAVKAQVTADVAVAADTALTIHGAIGYTWEHDLQIFYKRAKLDAQLFGGTKTWNERIAVGLALI